MAPAPGTSLTQRRLAGREARGSPCGPRDPKEGKGTAGQSLAHRCRTRTYLRPRRPSAAPRDDLTQRRPIPCRVGRGAPRPNGHFRGERKRERAGRAPLLRALNPHGGATGAPPGGLASRAVPTPALNGGGGAGTPVCVRAGGRERLPSVRRGGGGRPRAGAGVAEGPAVSCERGGERCSGF